MTNRAGSRYGNGRMSAASTKLKMATLPAIPSAQDDDRREGESAMVEQLTDREAQILGAAIDEGHVAHVPALFLPLLDAAEGAQRGAACVLARHSLGHIRFDAPLEMIANLIVQVLLDAAAADERSPAQRHDVEQTQQAHG